ncbi:MAG: regulatory protein RecX [Segetibacter sp.]
MLYRKHLTAEQALQKIRQYCTYQERCHKEVKEKLYSYGLHKSDAEKIIADIIENNYLNEERFAIQFAGGKFQDETVGAKKIQYELQQKGVSPYSIKVALKELDESDYAETLHKLASVKWDSLATEHYLTRQAKTQAYLMQKGFEPELISNSNQRIEIRFLKTNYVITHLYINTNAIILGR